MANPNVRFKKSDGSKFSDWEDIQFGNVASRITRKNCQYETDLPLTISAEYGLVDQNEFFNKTVASVNLSNYYLLKNGEFAYNKSVSKDAPWGAIKRLDKYDKGAVSTLYICFNISDNLDTDFVVQFFNTGLWHTKISNIATEGARTHGLLNISLIDFFEITFNFPEKAEQIRIANFFSEIDELIKAQSEKLEAYKQAKKSMAQKLFSQEVRFKKDDGSEFKNWECHILSDILIEYNEKCEKDGTYEHVSLTQEGIVPKTDKYNRDFLVTHEDKKYRVTHLNDICYNPANLKFGVICRNKYGDGIFSPIYVTFKVSEDCDAVFIENLVTRDDFINHALLYQQGTVYERMAVSSADLLSIKIIIPADKGEQIKIANCLSEYDALIKASEDKLNAYKQFKKSMMQKMFV